MRVIRTLTASIAAVIAVCLAVSGVTYALWSSIATASSSVAAGNIGITLTGSDSLAVTYTVSTLSKSATVTVQNSGTVSASYSTSVALSPASSSTLASGVAIKVWPVSADCSTAPASAAAGSWTSFPTMSGTIAAGATAQWCVLTTITSAQATTLAQSSVTPTFTAVASVGAWTASSAGAAFAQSVAAITPAAPTTSPVNEAAWNQIKTTLSPQLCIWPKYYSGPDVVAAACATANHNHWRFSTATNGQTSIISRTAPTTWWSVASATVGAQITLSSSAATTARWTVLSNTNGTVSFALFAQPTLCAEVTGASTADNTALSLAPCATVAAQQFQIQMIDNPTPATILLPCSSDGYNATYTWPALDGYLDSVVYRVKLDGVVIPTSLYGGGTAYDRAIRFQSSNSALVSSRLGDYAVALEQSVNGAAWTTTGTGVLRITSVSGSKFVNCG